MPAPDTHAPRSIAAVAAPVEFRSAGMLRSAILWGTAFSLFCWLVRAYALRDADSILYEAIARSLESRPVAEWIAPLWPAGWATGNGLFVEHLACFFWPAALLGKLGLRGALAANFLWVLIAFALLFRLSRALCGLEAGWLSVLFYPRGGHQRRVGAPDIPRRARRLAPASAERRPARALPRRRARRHVRRRIRAVLPAGDRRFVLRRVSRQPALAGGRKPAARPAPSPLQPRLLRRQRPLVRAARSPARRSRDRDAAALAVPRPPRGALSRSGLLVGLVADGAAGCSLCLPRLLPLQRRRRAGSARAPAGGETVDRNAPSASSEHEDVHEHEHGLSEQHWA